MGTSEAACAQACPGYAIVAFVSAQNSNFMYFTDPLNLKFSEFRN